MKREGDVNYLTRKVDISFFACYNMEGQPNKKES